MNEQALGDRIVWLDWMKTWAILSIIWGHFFSAGYVYLYVYISLLAPSRGIFCEQIKANAQCRETSH